MAGPGLYANIHAKKAKRVNKKKGSSFVRKGKVQRVHPSQQKICGRKDPDKQIKTAKKAMGAMIRSTYKKIDVLEVKPQRKNLKCTQAYANAC